MDAWTDGRKVITIAHPEQSSGELKMQQENFCKALSCFILILFLFFKGANTEEY